MIARWIAVMRVLALAGCSDARPAGTAAARGGGGARADGRAARGVAGGPREPHLASQRPARGRSWSGRSRSSTTTTTARTYRRSALKRHRACATRSSRCRSVGRGAAEAGTRPSRALRPRVRRRPVGGARVRRPRGADRALVHVLRQRPLRHREVTLGPAVTAEPSAKRGTSSTAW